MDIKKWNIEFFLQNSVDCLNYIKENYNMVPCINVNSPEYVDNGLVRFRGMIQDMYDPEYYLEKCEILNTVTNNTYTKNVKYIDVIPCNDNEEVDANSPKNVSSQRQTFVVISVPALNNWVHEVESTNCILKHCNDSMPSSSCKRPLDLSEEANTQSETSTTRNKKICNNTDSGISKFLLSKQSLLNFPIPGQTGLTCQIKIYEQNNNIKLNEVYEFVGFLSNAILPVQTEDSEFNDEMEIQTHNPPSSLIPKIHCISWTKLDYVNPLIEKINLDCTRMKFLKDELLLVFTQLMLGDDLAANYLLYHLLSKVYVRRELMAYGSFTLNISNVPVSIIKDYVEKLYSIIEMLVTKSHYLPMTLENMNSLTFIPRKDYVCNRLTSGMLQLSDGTHLVLDETKLSPGKLNEFGVKAVSAINNIIKNQKVGYDFSYYNMEFDCDIPILSISEGKSLLPSDKHIILRPSEVHINTFDEIYEATNKLLNRSLLDELRVYLTNARNQEYEISENMLEIIQNDFVQLRQSGTKFNADDLHQLLVLSRLVSFSVGKTHLDEECWRTAWGLENSLKARL